MGNIPFILSTVTTSSIERIAELTEGKSWFQLYHPAEETVKKDLLDSIQFRNQNPYVDVFILTHGDQDHCLGFKDNFYQGEDVKKYSQVPRDYLLFQCRK